MNGRAEALCIWHAEPEKRGVPANRVKHGFYAKGETERLAWVGREAPADFVQLGGLITMPESDIDVREREMDLHPLAPREVDADVAIAGLVHKMEIIDQHLSGQAAGLGRRPAAGALHPGQQPAGQDAA
jgi:hypothetical protein